MQRRQGTYLQPKADRSRISDLQPKHVEIIGCLDTIHARLFDMDGMDGMELIVRHSRILALQTEIAVGKSSLKLKA